MRKNGSLKKILSAVIALTMVMSVVLPIAVFATVTTPVAVATVTENVGGGQTKTITVTFAEEVADAGAVLDTDITVAGKTFGASTMALDAVGKKDLVITLAADATVVVGEDITFANNKIASADDPTDFFNGDVAITGSLDCATVDYSSIVPNDATITVDGYLTNPTSVGTGTFNLPNHILNSHILHNNIPNNLILILNSLIPNNQHMLKDSNHQLKIPFNRVLKILRYNQFQSNQYQYKQIFLQLIKRKSMLMQQL